MKTATVRELRNHYSGLIKWVEAGEEVCITRRGKAIARLVPEPTASDVQVDWSESPAIRRDRSDTERQSGASVRQLLEDSSGSW